MSGHIERIYADILRCKTAPANALHVGFISFDGFLLEHLGSWTDQAGEFNAPLMILSAVRGGAPTERRRGRQTHTATFAPEKIA
ncbi:hypothetical protein [Bradyrhizobium pachyrhizi]|uniref:hypothetical protein n=1 Tax=Bradyrhizobium pachyrhizi TaxID=280333 RepID=UPI00067E2D97|nr:hypothetical protein [Bradyrhizobium pachyrhizi]